MLGLVRGLIEWLPTSAAWAGYVAGPLVLLGYLVGSIPFGDLVVRRRFRRQLDRGRIPTGAGKEIDTAEVVTAILAAAVALLVATIAWDVGLAVAPRGLVSAVGTYSNQAVGAWVSIALWSGTAAVLGSMAPLWTGLRRGGSGVVPVVALLVAYAPILAAAGIATGSIAVGIGARWRDVVAVAMATIVGVAYLTWITDTQIGWGITHGPETGLWSAILAVMLIGRSRRDA